MSWSTLSTVTSVIQEQMGFKVFRLGQTEIQHHYFCVQPQTTHLQVIRVQHETLFLEYRLYSVAPTL